MTKTHYFYIAAILATFIIGCKKDSAPSNQKTTKADNSQLIIGNWERTSSADTVIYPDGQKDISGGQTNNDYGYIFKSDGTGTVLQLSKKVFDVKYSLSGTSINLTVTQAYNQDGSPSSVNIIPYSVNFVKLNDSQLVVRSESTSTNVNGVVMKSIIVDTYTKFP